MALRAVVVSFGLLMLSLVASSSVSAQTLWLQIDEDPFVCDGGTRIIGTVGGFAPGEAVEFRSPQLDGVFSRRTADDAGTIAMKWSCDSVKTWEVTVVGLGGSGSVAFRINGAIAPPPPDAPIGAAFDAKSAMTVEQMAIWKDFSPYSGVGIYLPVDARWDNRADKAQVNLTPGWVDAVLADGWQVLPIYVGWQAPAACATARFENMSADGATARTQGLAAAADAIDSMQRLGLGSGSPIYYDMEGYRPGCGRVVLSFIEGWTEALHAAGYLSGVYGSQNSIMTDLTAAATQGGYRLPDAVWVSTNSGVAGTLGLEAPPDHLWTNARIHQYRLSVTRTYGGVTLEVDDNIVDAATVVWQPPVLDTDGDGHAEPEPDNCDGIANPDQADLDGDGDGDVCDSDADGDSIADVDDPDPTDPNVPTAPTAEPVSDPTPTPGGGAEATAPPDTATAVPAGDPATDEDGSPTPDPEPTAAVMTVPTPAESLVQPRALPALTPTSVPAVVPTTPPTSPPTSPPTGEIESATVTITTESEDDAWWRVAAIAVAALAAVGFAAQGLRSFRRGRVRSGGGKGSSGR